MTKSFVTDEIRQAPRHAPHPSARRGDREALLNLYDTLDPARQAELLRLAVGMVRRGRGRSSLPAGSGEAS